MPAGNIFSTPPLYTNQMPSLVLC